MHILTTENPPFLPIYALPLYKDPDFLHSFCTPCLRCQDGCLPRNCSLPTRPRAFPAISLHTAYSALVFSYSNPTAQLQSPGPCRQTWRSLSTGLGMFSLAQTVLCYRLCTAASIFCTIAAPRFPACARLLHGLYAFPGRSVRGLCPVGRRLSPACRQPLHSLPVYIPSIRSLSASPSTAPAQPRAFCRRATARF